ncbi:salicylate hydroxylase [Fonsecaea pedrosoi]|nr:salicylate hydroxylase [Fonsecaea pedrosoi]
MEDNSSECQAKELSVLVVGAGIAGLCTAIALRRAGHRVKILERSPLLDEIGAAITLAPHAVKIFRSWGLDDAKIAQARLIPRLGQTFIDATTLEELAPTDRTDFAGVYGAPYLFAHRVDLHAMLRTMATGPDGPGRPAEVHTSCTVVEYDAGRGSVKVTGETDSWEPPADLVVAADGVHSRAASHVLGHDVDCAAHATDSTVIRFLIPTREILEDPHTAPLLRRYGDGHCSFYLHADRQRWLVRYPCRDNTLQNFGMYMYVDDDEEEQQNRRGWTQQCGPDDLRAAMAGFHPTLLRLCDKTDNTILPLWRCAERDPLPRCQRDRLVLIGDACHPMLPHRGFGAINAIEDAAALGVLFEDFGLFRAGRDRESIPIPTPTPTPSAASVPKSMSAPVSVSISALLETFEHIRLPRASIAQLYSQVATNKDPTLERRREAAKLLPEDELPGK